jgi:hypothetical protein
MSAAERDVRASLERMGLADRHAELSLKPLQGGVSSRILRVTIGDRRMCFKQAFAKLSVKADWYAPLSRNLAEANWIKTANEHAMRSSSSPTRRAPSLRLIERSRQAGRRTGGRLSPRGQARPRM